MDTLLFGINAVLPLLMLIGLGYLLSRIGFLNEHFLIYANKFVFRIALPAMLFYSIYNASGLEDINWSVLLYATIGVIVLFFLGLLSVIFFVKGSDKKGVVLQSVFRSNMAILGIPLADALGGDPAVLGVALISLAVIPLYNVLSVISLTMFQHDDSGNHIPWPKVLLKIVTNPLIIAIALGIIVLAIRSFIPVSEVTGELAFSIKNNLEFIYTFIKWVAQIASPLALIILGGGFQFAAVKSLKREIIIGTSWRILIAPLLGLSIAVILSKTTTFFHFESYDYPALIATFGSPVAVTSAIMAKEMGGDERLAGQIVVWSSILSILTIFIIVVSFRSLGIL
ncbi:MAG: AEC family transporter [Candidatus Izemoplasmatales bacterium]|jgi:hypothetical protein|nr:AEC family transporter [Candidatus Izemoplasmatales bacterium]